MARTVSSTVAEKARTDLDLGCHIFINLLGGLLDSKGKVAEEVHAIRKLGKSLRGGFSLFHLRDASCEIQMVGRLLSESRDSVVRLKTWQKLDWEKESVVSRAIGGLLEQNTVSAARRPPRETIDWCRERVELAVASLRVVPAERLEEAIIRGAKRLGRRVRKRFESLDLRSEEDFHDARKALKGYLGAISFLPGESQMVNPKMEGIADLLGDENDLATLADWLKKHGFTERFVPSLWKLIEKNRRLMRKRVVVEAEFLFGVSHEKA